MAGATRLSGAEHVKWDFEVSGLAGRQIGVGFMLDWDIGPDWGFFGYLGVLILMMSWCMMCCVMDEADRLVMVLMQEPHHQHGHMTPPLVMWSPELNQLKVVSQFSKTKAL